MRGDKLKIIYLPFRLILSGNKKSIFVYRFCETDEARQGGNDEP